MKAFCCKDMTEQINFYCANKQRAFECPDALICYLDKFNEYGLIIHDGGESFIQINYCPFCGRKLPKSKRDLWFDTLKKMGFDDPATQNIPKNFNNDSWYSSV